ncbi:LapA family protein [Nocardia sp. NPDC050412]|uniref:LapA family protein n=1 Tax=Nocardia sp. NPDC050412 TaxID=3364320 RepID=UPI00379587D7
MWSLPSKVNRPYVLSATKHRAHRRLRPAPAAAADQGFPHQSGQHLGEPGRWRRIPDRAPDFRSSEHDQRSFGSASLGGISLPIGVAILVAAVVGLLVMAVAGGIRIIQLRQAFNKLVRSRKSGARLQKWNANTP